MNSNNNIQNLSTVYRFGEEEIEISELKSTPYKRKAEEKFVAPSSRRRVLPSSKKKTREAEKEKKRERERERKEK